MFSLPPVNPEDEEISHKIKQIAKVATAAIIWLEVNAEIKIPRDKIEAPTKNIPRYPEKSTANSTFPYLNTTNK